MYCRHNSIASRIGSAIVVHTKRHHLLIIINIVFHLVLINPLVDPHQNGKILVEGWHSELGGRIPRPPVTPTLIWHHFRSFYTKKCLCHTSADISVA